MDFQERLGDYIDSLGLDIRLVNDSNVDDDSIALLALAGGKTIKTYYNGVSDKVLNYEISGKVKDENRNKVLSALYTLAEKIEDLTVLESNDESFEFNGIEIASEPFFVNATTDGFVYFSFMFQALLTTK